MRSWVNPFSRFPLPAGALTAAQIALVIAQGAVIHYLAINSSNDASVAAASFVIQVLFAVLIGHPTKVLAGGLALLLVLGLVPYGSSEPMPRALPIRGTILLDRQPQADVSVHVVGGPTVVTDANGEFSVTHDTPITRFIVDMAGYSFHVDTPRLVPRCHIVIDLADITRPRIECPIAEGRLFPMLDRRAFFSLVSLLVPAVAASATRQIHITEFDELTVGLDRPPIFFLPRHSIVHGTAQGTSGRFVQLLTRRQGRGWVVGSSVSPLRPSPGGARRWSLPLDVEPSPQTVQAILVEARLPTGLIVTGERWAPIVDSSDAFEVSSEGFERSRLRVIEVGGQAPVVGNPVPVAAFEELRIRTEGLPKGAIVHTLIEPADGDRVWVGDRLYVSRETVVWANGYFGRIDAEANAKSERDIHTPFWLTAVATTLPLPRSSEGIAPRDWLTLSKLIRASSPKVSLVRAVLPTQAEIRITKLGLSNDGVRYLAPRFTRVEGLFAAGRRYRPRALEIITLLTRAADSSGQWTVAAATTLKGNRAVWTINAADMQPAKADAERDSFIAIAVASYVPFDASRPVLEADIGARQFAISKEVHYRLMARRPQ